MKTTFSEMVSSQAYQKVASSFATLMIIVSTATLIYNFFTSENASFLTSMLVWFVWCLFGTSIFIALPVFVIHIFLIVQMSSHTEFPSGKPNDTTGKVLKAIASIWLFVGVFISIAATNYIIDFSGL